MEHKNVSLADQVFERMEADILSGKYERGEVLTEMKLCADMGVSRTPIREAAHRLAQEHLVLMTTKGITVLGVTDKDLVDIYDIRMRLEGMAAALAAKDARGAGSARVLQHKEGCRSHQVDGQHLPRSSLCGGRQYRAL